jgi:hypothetical protein
MKQLSRCMKNGKKKMKLTNLETELEIIEMNTNWHRENVKERAKIIRKVKCKRRKKRILKWLKRHLN